MNSDRVASINLDTFLNFIVDQYMPYMNGSEFKLFIFIYRQTIGANRQVNSISLENIITRTALTRNTVLKALRFLQFEGYIMKNTDSTPYSYSLNYSTIFKGSDQNFPQNYFLVKTKWAKTSTIVSGTH